MPRTARPALLLVAVLLVAPATLVLLAGCTSVVAGTPSAASSASAPSSSAGPGGAAESDPVRWVDGVCGALLPVVRTTSAPPLLDGLVDPADFVPELRRYLGAAATSTTTAIDDLRALGPSPVAGGDEFVTDLTDGLGRAGTSFREAATRLAGVDPSDPRSLAAAVPAVLAPLEGLAALPDPARGLRRSPELARAAEQAPRCRELEFEFR